jgi:flagellar biosynthesis protein FliQ
MTVEGLGTFVSQALGLAFWLSLPALLASALAGALAGAFQGATQVQDPALSFVPRLLAVAGALFLGGAWMSERLLAFAEQALRGLAP